MDTVVKLIVLSTNLKPEGIGKKINFRPDEIWSKGDKRGDTDLIEKESGFTVKSLLGKNHPIEEHISHLRKRIEGIESSLKEFSKMEGCEVQVSCVLHGESQPPLSFTKTEIDWINSIGASLDIDIYSNI